MLSVETSDILNMGLLFFSSKEIGFVWFTCVILSIDKLWIYKNLPSGRRKRNFIFLTDIFAKISYSNTKKKNCEHFAHSTHSAYKSHECFWFALFGLAFGNWCFSFQCSDFSLPQSTLLGFWTVFRCFFGLMFVSQTKHCTLDTYLLLGC